MKREGNLWAAFISDDNMLLAFNKARTGKQSRETVAQFCFDLELNLYTLQEELEQGSYAPGAYRQFTIRERKPRLISAAPFRDRVVHHALMNVLEPILEKRFYYHSYACRKGKGTHKAVGQYQTWANRYAYVLKLDIARYFPSIEHSALKEQLRRLIKDKRLLSVLDLIIDHSPSHTANKGLPIGNLTSQYFANLYLNGLDHWITSQTECKAYLRYVDDLIIFGDDKPELWGLRDKLRVELDILSLELHDKKQQLHRTSERVDVLGYVISRSRRWLRNDNGYRFRRKYRKYVEKPFNSRHTLDYYIASTASWLGHAKHGETMALVDDILTGTPRLFKQR